MAMATKKILRYIGIDFGTSTTLLRYRDYPADGSLDNYDIKDIRIDQTAGQSLGPGMMPTVIFDHGDGSDWHFGSEAEDLDEKVRRLGSGKAKGEFFEKFKMDLISQDAARLDKAKKLTEATFVFLYKKYEEKKERPEGAEVEEHTVVSFPVKWPDSVQKFMIAAAQKAGFKNVRGFEEPSAAMQYFLAFNSKSKDALESGGVIQEGKPLNVLLLDMGGGTTDLILYRYIPGRTEGHEVLATWPTVDTRIHFGGGEVDTLITQWLDASAGSKGLPDQQRQKLRAAINSQPRAIRIWKERVSARLVQKGVAEELGDPHSVSALLQAYDLEGLAPLVIDRQWIGALLANYLPAFPVLVNGLLEDAVRRGVIKGNDDIDLVVLVGGHSQWYFIKNILEGKWVPGLPGSSRGASVDADDANDHPSSGK